MATRRKERNPEARMALVEHLKELRNRLTIAALAVIALSVVGWVYYDQIMAFLAEPLHAAAAKRPNWAKVRLVNTDITGAFTIKMQIAVFAGLILSSPVWIWQVWAFIFPGLTGKEKRYASAFIVSAAPLFLLGCWTAVYVLPNAVEMFLSFTSPEADNLLPISEYTTWVTRFVLSFGLAYLLPLALVALDLMHILTAKRLLKGWRIAVVAILFFGALMSPTPDPWSMFALGLPLIGLYFGAVGVCALIDRRRKVNEPDWLATPDDVASPL